MGEKVQIHGFEIPQIIPQSHFLFGSDNTVDNREKLSSSKYVLLEAKTKMGNKWLIIPCTEILRFYFGVSSRLLSSTLAGELDTYFDFDKSGIENGRLKLHALKPLSRFEASVLGRTVASSDAKLAMNNVFNHLRSLHLNNTLKSPDHKEPLTISANFPFKDRTSLSISGKKILLASCEVILIKKRSKTVKNRT